MDPFHPKRSFSSSSYSLQNSSIAIEDADAAVEIGASEGDVHVPKPLDSLQGTPIPPFLSKTYDLVDDMRVDQIISWSDTGASFVVWDPVEFARRILPKNFKHNNFSSFIRQLNTYGFRKIDTDRWEFACESFMRGKRHLLKNIRRRKSLPAQHLSEESGSLSIEAEVDGLQKEKVELMQEVINLQHQQRGTHQYMESIKQKLQAAEDRQKQIVSSLARVFQIQKFKKDMSRKFIKHRPRDHDLETNPAPVDTTVRDLDIQSDAVPSQLHDLDLQELAWVNDPFPNGELDFNFSYEATSMVKHEDIWNGDFDTISAMPNRMWDDVGDYEYPEFGLPGGELTDFWNLADSSGEASQSWNTNQYGF